MTVRSEEIAWDVDGIPVHATLTRPGGAGPHPGVVFVAGSGPTDRDWCSPLLEGTNCSGRLLADALTREGFMTLRYDKRPSGPHAMRTHSGSWAASACRVTSTNWPARSTPCSPTKPWTRPGSSC